MRPDRACEIAADPLNADEGDMVAALASLALAYRESQRRFDADRAALVEAAELRRHRDDRDRRLAVAVELYERDRQRTAQVLDLLDGLAPEEAKRLRTEWGIWPGPIFLNP